MIDFSKYTSHCKKEQKIIISEENGCKHIANNTGACDVRHYKLDGEVFTEPDEQRCDYLLLNDTKKRAYYIELKGSDIEKAIEQINNSEQMIKDSIKQYTSFYRIIYRTGTHTVNSHKVIKWKEKCGKDSVSGISIAIVRQKNYVENI